MAHSRYFRLHNSVHRRFVVQARARRNRRALGVLAFVVEVCGASDQERERYHEYPDSESEDDEVSFFFRFHGISRY